MILPHDLGSNSFSNVSRQDTSCPKLGESCRVVRLLKPVSFEKSLRKQFHLGGKKEKDEA